MVFDVCLYHMGKLMKNKGLEYVGGEIHVIRGIDPDMWSYFEAMEFVREFKYDGEFKLWWKGSKEKAMNNLRPLTDDREAILLSNYAEANKEEVEIYVQHGQPSQVEEISFLTFGEEAEEIRVEEMEEHVVMDEEDIGGVEGNVEVQDLLLDDKEEEGNVEGEMVEEQDEEQDEEGNVLEGEGVENVDDNEEERMANDDYGFGMDNVMVEEERRNIKSSFG
ncbi:uncharacterized protein LOC106766222 [Vigna radiata var. radiata]|uniref:Uncharacterized protein LOC106766222 n=1 Tax=Vigna radiata var. radiata TaxID=3916 RepID=A0A1S3UKJ3_VIGRR|nr:uncharacterized protein LOC106766222 [Vigna radiata var. radiata]